MRMGIQCAGLVRFFVAVWVSIGLGAGYTALAEPEAGSVSPCIVEADSALGTTQPPTHTLGRVIPYGADLLERLVALKARGTQAVIVQLRAIPSPGEWEQLLGACEESGLDWWLMLTDLPMTAGWVSAPERYRMMGSSEGIVNLHLPNAERTLLVMAPRDDPTPRLITTVELTDGKATLGLGDTAENVLLFYPYLRNAMPDLWEGWDRYRDTLIQRVQMRKPARGFQGWLIHSEWLPTQTACMPLSPLASLEWLGFLKARYPSLPELERAWDLGAHLPSYEVASRLFPLWHEGRGIPQLVALDGAVKPQDLDPRRSKFWDDYHEFLSERWQSALDGLRTALNQLTGERAFVRVQTVPDPFELPLAPVFSTPNIPTALQLPALWRESWRTMVLQTVSRAPVEWMLLEWAHDSEERATLFQQTVRELGVRHLFWSGESLPDTIWSALRATDSAPTRPSFQFYPSELWHATPIQRYRSGWWVPSSTLAVSEVLGWGTDLHGFAQTVEVQTVDARGNLEQTRQVELCLWATGQPRELVLRRTDRNPLVAYDLNGEPVELQVRGDTVRLTVGTIPVRIRGFATVPICDSCVEGWIERAQQLLRSGAPTGQDISVLQFNLTNAVSVYRRNREQAFPLVRSMWSEVERAYQVSRWVEAESSRSHSFGMVRRLETASAGGTLWLNSPLVSESAPAVATFRFTSRREGTYTLWLACRIPPKGHGGRVEWQVSRASDENLTVATGNAMLDPDRAVSVYSDQWMWVPLGTLALRTGEYQLRLQWYPSGNLRATEWDAILVAPTGETPNALIPTP